MVHVAKVMAGTAVDALLKPDIIAAAKADHAVRAGGPYVCPLPADAVPPIGMSLAV
jgi:aminobenzoyl-glutamate utilization protein B